MLLVFLITSNATAVTLDDLEDDQDQIENDIEQSKEQVEAMEAKLAELNVKIDDLNTQILAVIDVVNGLNLEIEAKQAEIVQAKLDLEVALLEQADYKQQVEERIKVMYEYGNSGYVEVLLEANNLNDFFTRLEYLSQIMNYDDNMFVKLDSIQKDIELRKNQLESEEATLIYLKAEADAKKSDLDTLVAEREAQVTAVESDKHMMTAQIKEMEEEEAAVMEAIAKKIKELKALELKFKDGEFKWPVPGHYYISSYFGSRIHPIYGYTENHNGIDIPAGYGDDIIAAASGIVIRADYNKSYGNVIIINHGSGFTTLYAHNSQLLVKEGDGVAQGQVIAKAGSTGWSTGTHSHFAITLDGKWVNPLAYYKTN